MNRNDKRSDADSPRTDRRGFIKGAAAAGLMGLAPAAVAAAAAAPQAAVEDPGKPAGLGKMGLPDGRFPMMYEESVPQAIRVVLPPVGNYFISMLKDSALCATICWVIAR